MRILTQLAAGPGRRGYADLVIATFVLLTVGMMILPLPTPLLDVLIASNISVAVLLLLVAVYMRDALAFTSFPTVLLITTLYRLALNVSSTRLILLQADAGHVIYSFGHFVVRGNYVVGGVVFLVLTLVQFLVIAKGSERVAEVGARFTLDAMPGKQMSIDAELRSGGITQDEARKRRRMLQRESQLYGAMDGAMKFVKGDAIAGIVITVVNIVGGLAIGVAMRDMSAVDSLKVYGLLTIGDGLVSQIPALLISTAAGILVTRVASEQEDGSLGRDVGSQIFGNPRALKIAAVFLTVLAIVPGLPALPFAVLAVTFFLIARRITSSGSAVERGRPPDGVLGPDAKDTARWENLVPMMVPVGVAISAEIDAKRGPPRSDSEDLDRAIQAARERLFRDLGISLPPVDVRVDAALPPNTYAISLHELPAMRRTLPPDADRSDSIAREVETAVRGRPQAFVGIQEVQTMLDQLERAYPALVRSVVPKPVSVALLADVLRRLAEEHVSIRPLREILESLAVHAPAERDPVALAEVVRAGLRDHITHRHAIDGTVSVYLMDAAIEEAIRDAIQRTPTGSYLALPPDLARDIIDAVRRTAGDRPTPVLLTQSDIRRFVRRLLEVDLPAATVLSYQELVPTATIQPLGRIEIGLAAAMP